MNIGATSIQQSQFVGNRFTDKYRDLMSWCVPLAFIYVFILVPIGDLRRGGISVSNALDATAEGSAGNKFFWVLLVCFILYAWWREPQRQSYKADGVTKLLGIYLAVALASAAWSTVPGISLRRSAQQLMVIFCMTTPFILGSDIRKVFVRVCWVFVVAMLLNLLIMPLRGVPAFGYQGIYLQKNLLGQISVIACYFALYGALQERGKKQIAFALTMVLAIGLCLLSRSKTSLALLLLMPLVATMIVSIVRLNNPLARIAIFTGILLVLFALFSMAILLPLKFADVSNILFHDTTFTGRTRIWSFASYYIARQPWGGYGYGSFWGIGNGGHSLNEGFIGGLLQAHNGYVDVMLESGYVGVTLMTCLIFLTLFIIVKLAVTHRAQSILLLSVVLFILADNTMESSLLRGYTPLWIMFVFCSGVASAIRRDSRQVGMEKVKHAG